VSLRTQAHEDFSSGPVPFLKRSVHMHFYPSPSIRLSSRLLTKVALCIALASSLPALASAPSIASLQAKSEKGDAKASFDLAQRYQTGQGIPMDRIVALQHYELAAKQGSGDASYMLARHYSGVTGERMDLALAFDHMKNAAQRGHALAQTELAFVYYNGNDQVAKDLPQAFQWFKKAAANKSVRAQCMLGDFYKNGMGGAPQDYAQAFKWYKATATTESRCAPKSQLEMYAAYEAGHGVKKDLSTATEWLIRSAESGHPRAQYTLGNAYQRGYGVEKDVDLARTWIRKSREGVSYHDDHDHNQPSFAGPELAKRFAPFGRQEAKK